MTPPCEVNAAAQYVTGKLEEGTFDAEIGPVAGIVEVFVPTNSPTEAPTEETSGPTSETERPTSEQQ